MIDLTLTKGLTKVLFTRTYDWKCNTNLCYRLYGLVAAERFLLGHATYLHHIDILLTLYIYFDYWINLLSCWHILNLYSDNKWLLKMNWKVEIGVHTNDKASKIQISCKSFQLAKKYTQKFFRFFQKNWYFQKVLYFCWNI